MSDLVLHFLAGAVVSSVIVLLFGKRNPETDLRPDATMVVAGILPLFIGLAKEAYDKWWGAGNPEVADVTLTWAGGLAAMFLILFIDTFRTDKY